MLHLFKYSPLTAPESTSALCTKVYTFSVYLCMYFILNWVLEKRIQFILKCHLLLFCINSCVQTLVGAFSRQPKVVHLSSLRLLSSHSECHGVYLIFFEQFWSIMFAPAPRGLCCKCHTSVTDLCQHLVPNLHFKSFTQSKKHCVYNGRCLFIIISATIKGVKRFWESEVFFIKGVTGINVFSMSITEKK